MRKSNHILRSSDYIVNCILGLYVVYTFVRLLKKADTLMIVLLAILCAASVISFVLKIRRRNKKIRELEQVK